MDTLETLADREAIRALRVDFGHALDTRDWEMMPAILADEVEADLSAFGAPSGVMTRDDVVGWFRAAFRHEDVRTMQAYTNFRIVLDGDEATCSSYLHGYHTAPGFPGGDVFEIRARYDDRVRRTAAGWRIVGTVLTVIAVTGNMALVS